MEEIVVIKEGGEEEGSSNDTISFPKLQNLELCGFRNLKRFSSRKPLAVECEGLEPLFNEKVSFPMLECLELDFLHSVEMIWADELEEVSYMQNLKNLSVGGCDKLKDFSDKRRRKCDGGASPYKSSSSNGLGDIDYKKMPKSKDGDDDEELEE
uniref:Uncharacterized protein n=1 Tax=Cannabis sativa TaxID=3483 RepID=A0A803Q7I6_CANSA